MQVEEVDFVKGLEQALAHAAERGVIQVAMIGDHRHDAAPGLVNLPLGKAQELDVIILKPEFFLPERLAVHGVVTLRAVQVGFEQFLRPVVLIGRDARIGRVAQDDQNRLVLLDFGGVMALLGERGEAGDGNLLEVFHL